MVGYLRQALAGRPPRHVQQFLEEGHLRWDSLGEFCALVASFEHFGEVFKNAKAKLLAETLDQAIGQHLENRRGPSRRGERTGHPRQSFLPRSVLGGNAGQADPGSRAASSLQLRWPSSWPPTKTRSFRSWATLRGGRWILVVITIPMIELIAKVMRPSATLNAIVDAI